MNSRRLAMTAAAGGALLHMATATAYNAGEASADVAEKFNNPTQGWNHLWFDVVTDITIIGVIFALVMAYFVIRYRKSKDGQRRHFAPKLTPASAVAWVAIPVFVFLADDLFVAANGWALWNDYRTVPKNHMEVQLESGMYSWDYTYPNGVRAQNILRVPEGTPIVMRMTSRDTLHSFWIADFRVKEDSMPGRVTYLWFMPEKVGEHTVTCASYCGMGHSYMPGKIVVMPKADFDAWLQTELAAQTPAGVSIAESAKNKNSSLGGV